MPSLEQIAKGAKASGLTQKDFESRILANPRYSGVSREDIATAWGGGLKKKDQSSGISSPGERMESTESPSLSTQVPAPTQPTSVSEVAPSLTKQIGVPDVKSGYEAIAAEFTPATRKKLETGQGIQGAKATGMQRKINELKAGSYTAAANFLSIQNSIAEQVAMGLSSVGLPDNITSAVEDGIKNSNGSLYAPYMGELRSVTTDYTNKLASDVRTKNEAYNMSFDDALSRGEVLEAVDIAAGAFTESLPQMAAIVTAGALTGGFGAAAYGQVSSFDSYKKQLVRDYGLSEDEARKIAFGLATIEGAMDGVTGGMAKIGAQAIKNLGKEAGEKAVKGIVQKIIEKPALAFLGGTAGESAVEGATQASQNLLLKSTVDPELNVMDGVALSMAAGAIGGGVFSTPVVVAASVGKANDIKQRNEVNKKIDELYNALESGEVPSYLAEDVKGQLDKLVQQKRNMFESDLEFYDSMSEADQESVGAINKKIKALTEDLKAGKFDRQSIEAVRDVAKNLIVEKKNIEERYVSQEKQQVPGAVLEGEAPVETQPVQEAGRKETPAGRVVQEPKQEVGTVRSLINRKATYSDPVSETVVEGDVYQDGQRVVLETAEGKIFDIGNIDEMQDKSPREFGLMEAQERISVNEDGSFVYNGGDNQKIAGGTVMVNRRDGLKSIKRGKDGAIKTVTLTSPDGTQTYNLTGQDAVDAAYQIVLNFSTSPEQSVRVEQLLNENEQAKREIQQAARAATEVVTAEPVAVTAPKKAAADIVDVAVGRDGAGVTVAKIATTEEIADRINKEPKKSPVYVATRRAAKSLKKLFPDAEYVFVDSDAEAADYYRQNMPNVAADENGSDKGRIIQNKNNGKIEIVINTSSADATTVYHELVHAAFYKAYAQDAKTAIDFSNRLAKVLDSGTAAEKAIAKRVNDHVAKYKGDPEGVVSEEFLSELAGILAADAKSITQGMAAKIANFINNIAKKIGIGPVFTEAATTKEVVDFMNSFAAAAREGGNVVQDIANSEAATAVFRPSSTKSVKKIDIKETRDGFTRLEKFPTNTKSAFEFAGETFITTQSDRLASGEQVLPNGEKITLRGGFGYPAMTKDVWAASELGKAKTLAGQSNRQIKEVGYALLSPLVMAESSHKGNYTYFTAAMSLINSAADKKKLSNKKFLEVVKSAAKTAKVDASSVNANTVKENVDILMNLLSVEGGTF